MKLEEILQLDLVVEFMADGFLDIFLFRCEKSGTQKPCYLSYILEQQKHLLCRILELNLPFALFIDFSMVLVGFSMVFIDLPKVVIIFSLVFIELSMVSIDFSMVWIDFSMHNIHRRI